MIVTDLFEVDYGHSLSLNRLVQTADGEGVAFVSRTAQNNGIAAWVEPMTDLEPLPPGLITVSLRSRNHPLASFVQVRPFYTAFHIFVLVPRDPAMDVRERLWWAMCIEQNRYRYNFGRQANRSLRGIELPDQVPSWVSDAELPAFDTSSAGPVVPAVPPYGTWQPFRIDDLFAVHRGRSVTRRDSLPGPTPLVSASSRHNGISNWVAAVADHPAGCITVASNGSVGEAFVQPAPFVATADVTVLEAKTPIPDGAKHFICTVVRAERYRFNYGRKWPAGKLARSEVKLPVAVDGDPDFEAMDAFMRGLPLSRQALRDVAHPTPEATPSLSVA
jgi:hypothetical protein